MFVQVLQCSMFRIHSFNYAIDSNVYLRFIVSNNCYRQPYLFRSCSVKCQNWAQDWLDHHTSWSRITWGDGKQIGAQHVQCIKVTTHCVRERFESPCYMFHRQPCFFSGSQFQTCNRQPCFFRFHTVKCNSSSHVCSGFTDLNILWATMFVQVLQFSMFRIHSFNHAIESHVYLSLIVSNVCYRQPCLFRFGSVKCQNWAKDWSDHHTPWSRITWGDGRQIGTQHDPCIIVNAVSTDWNMESQRGNHTKVS